MNILRWNVKGVSRKGFKYLIRLILNSSDPDIMILMETEISIDRATQLVPFFKFCNYKLTASECLPRGLWLF